MVGDAFAFRVGGELIIDVEMLVPREMQDRRDFRLAGNFRRPPCVGPSSGWSS
jgi:hypothetical protein